MDARAGESVISDTPLPEKVGWILGPVVVVGLTAV
jgi:hypothetical protein